MERLGPDDVDWRTGSEADVDEHVWHDGWMPRVESDLTSTLPASSQDPGPRVLSFLSCSPRILAVSHSRILVGVAQDIMSPLRLSIDGLPDAEYS